MNRNSSSLARRQQCALDDYGLIQGNLRPYMFAAWSNFLGRARRFVQATTFDLVQRRCAHDPYVFDFMDGLVQDFSSPDKLCGRSMILPAFEAPGRFYRGNLHTHSSQSDGVKTPEEVCAHYREAGYDFLALTDHFRERFGYPVTNTRPFRTNRFTTLLGAELHAPANSHGEIWHILSVGLPEDFAPTGRDETGPEMADRALDTGAFVAIAHPHWSGLKPEDGRALPRAQAVEIYNNTCEMANGRGDGAMFVDALLNDGRDITLIATDDAHFRHDDACGGWVMVKAEANEPEALLAALKAGHFYASQGPEIHAAEVSGGTLKVECSPVELIVAVGRGTLSTRAQEPGLTRAEIPLECFGSDWFRFFVRDARGRSAWSSPVRL